MKKNVAVLMGGYSSEYEISIKSGDTIFENIDKTKYNVFKVIIKTDSWFMRDEKNVNHKILKDDFSVLIGDKKINFDIAFIMIHGSPGEDGIIQSYLESLGIAYTGCNSEISKLTFNKNNCKNELQKFDIPMAKSIILKLDDFIDFENIIKKIGIPCFVKANESGSSYGVFKVNKKNELTKAIENAFKYDSEILIESFLDGKEVSVGVMKFKNEIKVFGITELVTENDFFDYEAKYEGKSIEITPANITYEQKKRVTNIVKKIYSKLEMKGFSRSEFIFVNNIPYFLEINSIPGMTKESILPQQLSKIDISIEEIVNESIEQAIK
tara:strand:+ start:217 stop:1191 length:975 start_codon:yes stop_codon:yes gene_type:complete